jgi:hypothetical protein
VDRRPPVLDRRELPLQLLRPHRRGRLLLLNVCPRSARDAPTGLFVPPSVYTLF